MISKEQPCELHTFRLNNLEDRMNRLEKFIISVLIFFTLISISNIFLIYDLPNKINKQVSYGK